MSANEPDEPEHYLDASDGWLSFHCQAAHGAPCRSGCVEQCQAWGDGALCDHPTGDLGSCTAQEWIRQEGIADTIADGHDPIPVTVSWDGDRVTWSLAGGAP